MKQRCAAPTLYWVGRVAGPLMLLRLASITLLSLLVFACQPKSQRALNRALLEDFLEWKENSPRTRKQIAGLLYDIQVPGRTIGRAIHLGDGLFLTAYHVVDKLPDDARIVQQKQRETFTGAGGYIHVLAHDKANDVALLRTASEYHYGDAHIHLTERQPKPGDEVVEILYATKGNTIEHIGYKKVFSGSDLYTWEKIPQIGMFYMAPRSRLYEVHGYVFENLWGPLQKIVKGLKEPQKEFILTSISGYNGESGGAIFTKLDANKFAFTSLISIGFHARRDYIHTPRHPLGESGFWRTWGLDVPPDAIRKLVKKYLRQLERDAR